jgi:hypothetical protein
MIGEGSLGFYKLTKGAASTSLTPERRLVENMGLCGTSEQEEWAILAEAKKSIEFEPKANQHPRRLAKCGALSILVRGRTARRQNSDPFALVYAVHFREKTFLFLSQSREATGANRWGMARTAFLNLAGSPVGATVEPGHCKPQQVVESRTATEEGGRAFHTELTTQPKRCL